MRRFSSNKQRGIVDIIYLLPALKEGEGKKKRGRTMLSMERTCRIPVFQKKAMCERGVEKGKKGGQGTRVP